MPIFLLCKQIGNGMFLIKFAWVDQMNGLKSQLRILHQSNNFLLYERVRVGVWGHPRVHVWDHQYEPRPCSYQFKVNLSTFDTRGKTLPVGRTCGLSRHILPIQYYEQGLSSDTPGWREPNTWIIAITYTYVCKEPVKFCSGLVFIFFKQSKDENYLTIFLPALQILRL